MFERDMFLRLAPLASERRAVDMAQDLPSDLPLQGLPPQSLNQIRRPAEEHAYQPACFSLTNTVSSNHSTLNIYIYTQLVVVLFF